MRKVVFKNIESEIVSYLEAAEDSINIAVTWFTNDKLFDTLLTKLGEKVAIHLMITSDDINFPAKGLDFKSFIAGGGKLSIQNKGMLMHHKFCIIDNKVLLNGSYNWTRLAETSNNENVVAFEHEFDLIDEFDKEFLRISNADGILVNAIPFFNTQPTFYQPTYDSIEYINSDKDSDKKTASETVWNGNGISLVEKVFALRLHNDLHFIPMWIYTMNGAMAKRALYFAWENEHDLNAIKALKKHDSFLEGSIILPNLDNKFPDFFFKIAKECGLFHEIFKYQNQEKIPISVFVKKGETKDDSLLNLGYTF